MIRAMVVNAAQLATYSQAKQFLLSTCKCVACSDSLSIIIGIFLLQLTLWMILNAILVQV